MRLSLCLVVALFALGCSGASSDEPTTHTPATEPAPTPSTPEPSTPEPTAEAPIEGPLCGTRGAPQCAAGTFCDFPAGSECGATDRGGHCVAIPEMCTREFMPVCGCDGQTHPTACVAHSNGVSVSHDGPC